MGRARMHRSWFALGLLFLLAAGAGVTSRSSNPDVDRDVGPGGSGPNQRAGVQTPPPPVNLDLTVSGQRFKVDGQTRFLVFVSYFDALHASTLALNSDFSYLKSKGVDGIRILPNWWRYASTYPSSGGMYFAQDTLIAPDGGLRSGPLTKLLDVLNLAKRWGLIVDLSFSAETVRECPADNCLSTKHDSTLDLARFRDGLVALAKALNGAGSGYTHVFFDIQNESDKPSNGPRDKRPLASYPLEVKGIVQAIHAVDRRMIVTASLSGGTTTADAKRFAGAASLDIVAWHEPRDPTWWNDTAARVSELRDQGIPVYLQEPEPAGDRAWTLAGIKANVSNAYDAGAAAWCFHTRTGFYLTGSNLQSHLSPDEVSFLDSLRNLMPDR
jgi:hypothetical protein